MISFVLSQDIIITSEYWDLLGLISNITINFCSSKTNCTIDEVFYNKNINNNNIFNTKITPIVLLGNDLGQLWNNK